VGLDDFGSGYSSLNMLQNIQADELKLDMGFLQKLDHWERGTQIIKLVTDLAKSLNMKVVAEGVETEEQARYLQEIQCDYLQGFYYSKPIPVEEFEKKYLA
jgi:EAL domain-containing protein (putative c-di-GMP-specific phosphodiesterase class I)